MRSTFPNRRLIEALDLAATQHTSSEHGSPATAGKNEPPESKEWNKGLSLDEQRRLYRTAGQYAIKQRLAREIKARFGEQPYLTKKEFNAIDWFRAERSDQLNHTLRNGDTHRSTSSAEKTINSGLQKLADQGCRAHGMALRGVSASAVDTLHETVREGRIHQDDGIPFFTPDKGTALEYTRPLEEENADLNMPGMLLHGLGENGTYSLNPWYPDIVFYKSKTPFNVELKAFDDKKDHVYKALLVEKASGKVPSGLRSGDALVLPTSKAHLKSLEHLARASNANGPNRDEVACLQDNLAVAMQHLSPHSLCHVVKEYVHQDGLKQFEQDFPLTYRRTIDIETVRNRLADELEALFPEEIGKHLALLIALSPEGALVQLDAQAVRDAVDRILQDPRVPLFLRRDLRLLQERADRFPYRNAVSYTYFDTLFDQHFSTGIPETGNDLKVARYLVKEEIKKKALTREHYFELRVDAMIRQTTENGTARGGEQERFALLEKISHLLSPITPAELTSKVLPHIAPDKLAALNATLKRHLSDPRQSLLARQLARLPRNMDTDHLMQHGQPHGRQSDETSETVVHNLGEARHRLLNLKHEVGHLGRPAAPRVASQPQDADERSTPSRSWVPRSQQALEQNYPGVTRAMMARLRAMEENKSSGRIYTDAAKIGITPERIDRMLARQVPLAFPDPSTYRQFKQELQTVLEQCGLEDSSVTSGGTATDFYSKNPRKPAGWHFDTPQSEKPSDLDLFISGPEFLNHMRTHHAYFHPPREFSPALNPSAAARLPQQLYPWREIRKHFPLLDGFVRKWENTLGREITLVGMSEGEDPTVREFVMHEPAREKKR